MSVDFVLECVKYRTRFYAYQRIDAMDVEHIRSTFMDWWGGEEYADMSEADLRQQVKNIADTIYTDTIETVPGTVQMELDGKTYIFAGGFWDDRGDSPSEAYDNISMLNRFGIDND